MMSARLEGSGSAILCTERDDKNSLSLVHQNQPLIQLEILELPGAVQDISLYIILLFISENKRLNSKKKNEQLKICYIFYQYEIKLCFKSSNTFLTVVDFKVIMCLFGNIFAINLLHKRIACECKIIFRFIALSSEKEVFQEYFRFPVSGEFSICHQ